MVKDRCLFLSLWLEKFSFLVLLITVEVSPEVEKIIGIRIFFKNEDNYSVLLAGVVDVSLIMVVTLFFLFKWVAEIDVMRRNNCSHETSDISSSATFVLLNGEDTYDRKKRKHFHLVPCTQLKLLSFAIELLNRCLS